MKNKILIIDDNLEICEMYKTIFELEGFNVKIENDGLKGIMTSLEFNPDLIILDIMMPKIDGFEVLQSIREQTSLTTKIIVNSNLTQEGTENKVLDLGADKFLNKSDYSPNDLLTIIKEILGNNTKNEKIKKVLIIDDNPEICEMYKIVLEMDGYQVKIEANGAKGISTALKFQPNFIILDIMMPNVNGFEILESLNEHSDLNSTILVNSNLNSIEDETKALKLGAKKFLRKADYTPVQVASIIKDLNKKN